MNGRLLPLKAYNETRRTWPPALNSTSVLFDTAQQ
jgi:hypothetical protein